MMMVDEVESDAYLENVGGLWPMEDYNEGKSVGAEYGYKEAERRYQNKINEYRTNLKSVVLSIALGSTLGVIIGWFLFESVTLYLLILVYLICYIFWRNINVKGFDYE